MLELSHAFFGHAELSPEFLEGRPFLRQSSLMNDPPLARRKLIEGLSQPTRPSSAVAHSDHDLFGTGPQIGKEILPIFLTVFAQGHVQRLVSGAEPNLHCLHFGDADIER